MNKPFADPEREQLLTAEQLAERWQVSAAHVYRLAREGKIPCVKLGRYVRFRLDQVEFWERGDFVFPKETTKINLRSGESLY